MLPNSMGDWKMSTAELKKLIASPKKPSEPGSAKKWAEVEEELGTKLPADYHEFVDAYGSGLFANFYRVNNPFSADEFLALIPASNSWAETLREEKENDEDAVPYPIFPETGGLLHWANDDNGNTYYWKTAGAPDKWTVVQRSERGDGFKEHKCSMSAFLVGVLTKKIKALASGYPNKDSLVFESY